MRDEDFRPRYYAVNGREMNQREWSKALSHYRHIGLTEVRVRGHDLEVSTVWLGLDHGWLSDRPLIFETMVFEWPRRVPFMDLMCRYSTLAEAQRGHRLMVRGLKRIVRSRRTKQLIHNGGKP